VSQEVQARLYWALQQHKGTHTSNKYLFLLREEGQSRVLLIMGCSAEGLDQRGNVCGQLILERVVLMSVFLGLSLE